MPVFLCFVLLFAPLQAPSGDDDPSPEDEARQQLAKVRRIYVSILTGGDAALQIRDLLMTSLQRTKQFTITEDEDKADAVLKGSGDDDVFTDVHQSAEGINAHSQFGTGESEATRYAGSSSSNHYGGITIGENDSRHSEERKHEAIVTVRLVSKDEDVIWSATAESLGAKFMGASADVADKIAKRLAADFKAAKRQTVEPHLLDAPLEAAPAAKPPQP